MPEWKATLHWDVTRGQITADSMKHYNHLVDRSGRSELGVFSPEDQIPPLVRGKYAAHTRGNNSYNISVVACAMYGAQWTPDLDQLGEYPITEIQFEECCKALAVYAEEYDIPVERGRIDTHAEVEMNRGVDQNGKWDITVLVLADRTIKGARAVGDYMRERVSHYLVQSGRSPELARPADIPTNFQTVEHGDRGPWVKMLQQLLHDLGYHPGRIDGIFGGGTRGALLTAQADHGLKTDGIAGPRTWAKLTKKGQQRAKRDISEKDLEDSGTLADTRRSDRLADVVTAAGIGGIGKLANDANDQIDQVQGALDNARSLLGTIGTDWYIWAIAAMVIGYLIWRGLNHSTRKRRVSDAQEWKHVGR